MIAIVDYQAGNIGSVANALNRIGALDFKITDDKETIENAEAVIFPGQGRAGPAMQSLEKSGLDILLPRLTQPFLGICLGMQLLFESSEEDNTKALGIISGNITKLQSGGLPIPHMGWNKVIQVKQSKLFEELNDNSYFYFANSYVVDVNSPNVIATTNYGESFGVAVEKDNFFGVQFHPEKSAEQGEKVLENFIKMVKKS